MSAGEQRGQPRVSDGRTLEGMQRDLASACITGDASQAHWLLEQAAHEPFSTRALLSGLNAGLLHVAASRNHVAIIELLLAAQPDLAHAAVTADYDTGRSALATCTHEHLADLVLGCATDAFASSPLASPVHTEAQLTGPAPWPVATKGTGPFVFLGDPRGKDPENLLVALDASDPAAPCPPFDDKHCDHEHALHRAAMRGHEDAVRAILEAAPSLVTAQPLMTSSDKVSGAAYIRLHPMLKAIRSAASYGHLGALLVLVEAALTVPIPREAADSLIWLSSHRDVKDEGEILRALLRVRAHAASSSGEAPWYKLNYSHDPPFALQSALSRGHLDSIADLLHAQPPIDDKCRGIGAANMLWQAIRPAAQRGDVEMVRALLLHIHLHRRGEPWEGSGIRLPDKPPENSLLYALQCACEAGSCDVVEAVLSMLDDLPGDSVQVDGESKCLADAGFRLRVFRWFGRSSGAAMRQLLRGIPPLIPKFSAQLTDASPHDDWICLHFALQGAAESRKGFSAVIDVLLDCVPAEARCPLQDFARSALLHGARRGRTSIMRRLLAHGAVADALLYEAGLERDARSHGTALHAAALRCREPEESRPEVVRLIVQSCPEADSSQQVRLVDMVSRDFFDGVSQTALHWAARYGDMESLPYLLEAGADASVRDSDGNVPLQAAAIAWHTRVMERLADFQEIVSEVPELAHLFTVPVAAIVAYCLFIETEHGLAQTMRCLICAEAPRDGLRHRSPADITTGEIVNKVVELAGPLPGGVKLDAASPCVLRSSGLPAAVVATLLLDCKDRAFGDHERIELASYMLHDTQLLALKEARSADLFADIVADAAENETPELVHVLLAEFPRDRALSEACMEQLCGAVGGLETLSVLLRDAAPTADFMPDRLVTALRMCLRRACSTGDIGCVRVLLDAHWPGDSLAVTLATGDGNGSGLGCLHDILHGFATYATKEMLEDEERCYPQVIDALIAAGASVHHVALLPDLSDDESRVLQSPLHTAVESRHLDLVRALLRYPGQLELRDEGGNSALHIAASAWSLDLDGGADPDLVFLLLSAHAAEGVDVDLVNDQGITALYNAVRAHNVQAVQLLLEAGADAHICDPLNGGGLLHVAVSNVRHRHKAGRLAHLLLSVERPPDVHQRDADGLTALGLAAIQNSDRFLQAVHNLDPDALAQGPEQHAGPPQAPLLWLAARHGSTCTVQYLLSVLPPADAGRLGWAHEADDPAAQRTETLTEVTPLMAAAANGRLGCVRALLSIAPHGCIDAVCSGQRRTALHYAARYGHTGVVRALMDARQESKLCIDVKDAYGGTPLQYAVQYSHYPLVMYLLSQGADSRHTAACGRSLFKVALAREYETPVTAWILQRLLHKDIKEGRVNDFVRELLVGHCA